MIILQRHLLIRTNDFPRDFLKQKQNEKEVLRIYEYHLEVLRQDLERSGFQLIESPQD